MRAALIKLYRNTLFRLSLLGAVFFVVALIIALGNVYFLTISSELRQVDKSLAAEVEEFQTILDKAGLIPLGNEIFLRSGSGDRHYLLTSRNQNGEDMVIGSLGEQVVTLINQEKTVIGEEGDADFTKVDFILVIPATDTVPATERRMRGLSGYLQIDGKNVAAVVASRDVEVTRRTAERVKNAIWTSSAIALILGLISSWFVSRKFTQRVEAFNRLATDVRAGHLDRRAPRNYSEDEMDLLAEHLNDMSEISDPMAQETLFAASDDADQLLKTFDSVLRIARLEIKYTPKGGAIHFSLKKNKDGRPEISIVDDGPGIPAGSRQRVKERFVRLDESRSEPGSGLGLALVDAIADLHRATFSLEDGRTSQDGARPGLAARLTFPRIRKQKQPAPAASLAAE